MQGVRINQNNLTNLSLRQHYLDQVRIAEAILGIISACICVIQNKAPL